MGCLVKCMGALVLVIAIATGYVSYKLNLKKEVPQIKLSYWGPGKSKPDDKSIKPFKINIPDEALQRLKAKLDAAEFSTPPLEGTGFQYGFSSDHLQTLVKYWRTEYNWRDREAFLNKFPQFKTQIGGLDIHFIHVKPDPIKAKGKVVVPLMISHGWPGSVREFYDIIPMLTTPRADVDFVFELVAPSLPGFAFSQGASKVGMGSPQIGTIFNELMNRLGFEKYYFQGGDWGSVIGHAMSVMYPDKILGYHTNLCNARTPKALLRILLTYLFPQLYLDEPAVRSSSDLFKEFILETGYFHIQATKPDTIGAGLTDSPIGLAAYILEKFSSGTDKAYRALPNGGLDKYKEDDLLDNVMIYYFTKSITSAMRIYSETFVKGTYSTDLISTPAHVPTGCARFPHEIFYFSKYILEGQYTNLKQVSSFDKGGHFAAFEEPQLLADDIWKFVKVVRS